MRTFTATPLVVLAHISTRAMETIFECHTGLPLQKSASVWHSESSKTCNWP